MAKPRGNRQKDLLRPALEDIIDLAHPLTRLAHEIDWQFLDGRFASKCTSRPRQPPSREPFARPLPGACHNIAKCSVHLNPGDQPFFTGDARNDENPATLYKSSGYKTSA